MNRKTDTMRPLILLLALLTTPAFADPLTGKSYIIQLSSSQYASGYGKYLLPPLVKVLKTSGMKAKNGPGADVVVNVEPDSDVGKWVKTSSGRQWTYTITAMVGISPESYDLPEDGTPVFGVKATLATPSSDSEAEMDCLITLAARVALRDYKPKGIEKVDGQSCLGAR